MSIETSRVLGGVGAILMLIGVLPYVNYFSVVGVSGLILVMVALYNLATYHREGAIFNNALYGVIVAIVGAVIATATIVVTVLSSLTDFLYTIFPEWNGDWATLSGLTPNTANITIDSVLPFIVGAFTMFVILWVFSILGAFLVRRSLGALAAKSGVGLFSTAGLLMFVGAALIAVFGVGLILIWVSVLLLGIAFFRMRPQPAQPTTSAAPT